MLTIVHLGGGGTYSRYVQDCVRRIARRRPAKLQSELRASRGQHVVAIADGCPLLDDAKLGALLEAHPDLMFVVGDSNGMPSDALMASDERCSLSGLTLGHQVQAMVLAEAIEASVYGGVAV